MSFGKRAPEQGTYITPRVLYRDDVKALDTDVTSDGIPIIDTRSGPNGAIIPAGQTQSDKNMYGQDARILLSVLSGSVTTVTVSLWLKSEVYDYGTRAEPGPSSSSADVPHLPATGEWVKVGSQVATGPSLLIFTGIPPGEYKALISAWTGNGGSTFVTLEESHAA